MLDVGGWMLDVLPSLSFQSFDFECATMLARFFSWQLNREPRLVMRPVQRSTKTNQAHIVNFSSDVPPVGCQRCDDHLLFRPAHEEGVERFAFRGEPHVGFGKILAAGFVALFPRTGFHYAGAFAKNFPRACAVNGAPGDGHPGGDLG